MSLIWYVQKHLCLLEVGSLFWQFQIYTYYLSRRLKYGKEWIKGYNFQEEHVSVIWLYFIISNNLDLFLGWAKNCQKRCQKVLKVVKVKMLLPNLQANWE